MPNEMLAVALRIGEFEYKLRETAALENKRLEDYTRAELQEFAEKELHEIKELIIDVAQIPNTSISYLIAQHYLLADFIIECMSSLYTHPEACVS